MHRYVNFRCGYESGVDILTVCVSIPSPDESQFPWQRSARWLLAHRAWHRVKPTTSPKLLFLIILTKDVTFTSRCKRCSGKGGVWLAVFDWSSGPLAQRHYQGTQRRAEEKQDCFIVWALLLYHDWSGSITYPARYVRRPQCLKDSVYLHWFPSLLWDLLDSLQFLEANFCLFAIYKLEKNYLQIWVSCRLTSGRFVFFEWWHLSWKKETIFFSKGGFVSTFPRLTLPPARTKSVLALDKYSQIGTEHPHGCTPRSIDAKGATALRSVFFSWFVHCSRIPSWLLCCFAESDECAGDTLMAKTIGDDRLYLHCGIYKECKFRGDKLLLPTDSQRTSPLFCSLSHARGQYRLVFAHMFDWVSASSIRKVWVDWEDAPWSESGSATGVRLLRFCSTMLDSAFRQHSDPRRSSASASGESHVFVSTVPTSRIGWAWVRVSEPVRGSRLFGCWRHRHTDQEAVSDCSQTLAAVLLTLHQFSKNCKHELEKCCRFSEKGCEMLRADKLFLLTIFFDASLVL